MRAISAPLTRDDRRRAGLLRRLRERLRLGEASFAKLLRVSPARLTGFEAEREAWPLELVTQAGERINAALECAQRDVDEGAAIVAELEELLPH